MQIKRDEKLLFADVEALFNAYRFAEARQKLDAIHIEFHDDGPVHVRVHLWQFRIARLQRDALGMAREILPIVFAVPVSYVQKHLGLALPSRMKH